MSRRTHCMQGHAFTPENTYIHTYKKTGVTKRWCKKCRGINGNNAYSKNPIADWDEETVAARHEYERNSRLLRIYGITVEEYDTMFKTQNGLCAICGKPETTKKKSLSVDHDHQNGTIRKLLCHHCNSMIGHAKENLDILQRAVQYLKEHTCPTPPQPTSQVSLGSIS